MSLIDYFIDQTPNGYYENLENISGLPLIPDKICEQLISYSQYDHCQYLSEIINSKIPDNCVGVKYTVKNVLPNQIKMIGDVVTNFKGFKTISFNNINNDFTNSLIINTFNEIRVSPKVFNKHSLPLLALQYTTIDYEIDDNSTEFSYDMYIVKPKWRRFVAQQGHTLNNKYSIMCGVFLDNQNEDDDDYPEDQYNDDDDTDDKNLVITTEDYTDNDKCVVIDI